MLYTDVRRTAVEVGLGKHWDTLGADTIKEYLFVRLSYLKLANRTYKSITGFLHGLWLLQHQRNAGQGLLALPVSSLLPRK